MIMVNDKLSPVYDYVIFLSPLHPITKQRENSERAAQKVILCNSSCYNKYIFVLEWRIFVILISK